MRYVSYDYNDKSGDACALFVKRNGQSIKLLLSGKTVKTEGNRKETGHKTFRNRKDAASAFHTYLNVMKERG